MKFEQIKELIKMLQETNISEFKYESSELNLSIRTKDFQKVKEVMVQPTMIQGAPMGAQVSTQSQMVQNTAPTEQPVVVAKTEAPKEEAPKADIKYIEIKSPMVGTFYRSSSPDKPVYIKVGDTINPESVVCLIEAMKLFNDVKAEVSGRIVKVMVEDASPVEYEQVLFLVEPL
jgi:acetyl-CoA carboxylase biotin carboxyl carrier protein